jgi:hypothetical protein
MTRLTLVVGLLGILLATAFGQGKLMQADIPEGTSRARFAKTKKSRQPQD